MTKREQIISYLVKLHKHANKTVLMKLSYIVDLTSIARGKEKLTDFNYIRYYYGPFDSNLYIDLKNLLDKKIILEKTEFTNDGEESPYYSINENKDINLDLINKEEFKIIDEILDSLKGYGAKTLTNICYETKPMKAIGAKLDNKEGICKVLDLNLVRNNK